MDFYKVPIGFGMALAQNTAAMNRYAHLTEEQKQAILNKLSEIWENKDGLYDDCPLNDRLDHTIKNVNRIQC